MGRLADALTPGWAIPRPTRAPRPPRVDVALAAIAVLQAEATIALCDAMAELAPRDQATGLQNAAARLGRGIVASGLR